MGDRNAVIHHMVYVKKTMPEVLVRREILDGVPVAILYDAVRKEAYHLAGEGGRIWELMDGKRTTREIAAELCREFGMDEAEAVREVVRFVLKIGRLDLIRYAYEDRPENSGDDVGGEGS
ncbi:PqqD family protein [Deferrisoma sp.]